MTSPHATDLKPPRPGPVPKSWRARGREIASLGPFVARTFRILLATSPRGTALLALTTALAGVFPAALAWVGKLIIDSVVTAARATNGGFSELAGAGLHRTLALIGLELGLMVFSLANTRTSALLRELLRAELGNRINVDILEKALTLELAHFQDAETYDKMQRARREASSRPLSMVLGVASLAQNGVTLASYTLLLARLAPWSVVVLFAASIPAFISEARLSTESFRLASWRAPETRRLNYLEWILTRDTHVKEVKLFDLGALILGRYRALFDKFFREDRALAIRRFAWGLSLTLASVGAFYACYALAARQASRAQITLGDLTLYVAVFRQGQGAFQSILGGVSGLYEDALFMSNLFAFLDLPVKAALRLAAPAPHLPSVTVQPTPSTNAPLPPGPLPLELRDVSFRYPGSDHWALRHLSLTIAPGEVVALCGDNGAGKSTLVNLLLRLFDPTEGLILYGGRPLATLPLDELRLRMSAVFQDFVRYQFSVAENIGLGFPPGLEDRGRIEAAARAGGADAVVAGLPQGLDTVLGGFFEKGQEISVGQWQKVATARAFMRPAEILILDEPTASLDAEAEYEMWRRFQHLVTGKTALLISHRMSTLRLAHRIVVLRGGGIEEQGTHDELMRQDGRYAHLFKLQAQGYVDS